MQKDWQRKKVDTRRGLHSTFVYVEYACVLIVYDLYLYGISCDIVQNYPIFIYTHRIFI